MSQQLDDIRALFEPAPGSIYLDTATFGLPPRPTVAAMQRALADWQTGSADWVPDWDQRGELSRQHFAELIGAQAESVALVPSVSTGVGIVAASLQAGDEVLLADDEFTSVVYPLLVAERRGISVHSVPFTALAERVTASTRLVAFSLVQSHSGRVAALPPILEAAAASGARTLVDATHAVPFVRLQDARGRIDRRIDFVACAAYKHLLSPRGVSFLYVAPHWWDSVPPVLANWRSARQPYGDYYGGSLDLAPNAARFDVSLDWFAHVGASVSLGLLADWQRRGHLDHVLRLAARLAQALGLEPTGSTVVSVPVADAEAVRRELAASGIRAAVRAGSVRLAPHVYTTQEEIERAALALAPFVRQPVGR